MKRLDSVPPRAGKREWVGLAVLALPTLLVSLDTFVMLLAIPHLSADLHANSAQQLWIMDIYGFMIAGFMITMGTLGDRVGRRKLLLVGAGFFGVASVLAAYSTSAEMLIASRALLGIAGATVTPSTLSLISTMFRDPKQKASAIGLWAGCFTVGAIIGPVVGGAMLDHFWWGSVFLLGVPAMVLLLALGPILLPEYRDTAAGRLDLPSVGLSLASILPIIHGLKELARNGWQPVPIASLVLGVAVGVVFVRRQNRLAHPLLDLRLFANKSFSTTLGSMMAFSMLSGGTMVFVAQYFQLVDGLTPLRAGLALVPGMVAATISFQLAPLLGRRFRPAHLFPAGLAISVVGLLLMTTSGTSGAATLMVGFAVTSFGTGPLVSLGTNLVIGSVPPQRAGSAAALSQTGNEFGYALGIALLGSVMTAVYRTRVADSLPVGAPDAARDTLAGATEAAQRAPGQLGAAILDAAHAAFVDGLHTVATLSAVVLAGTAILLLINLRGVPALGHHQASAEPADAEQGSPTEREATELLA